LQVILAFLCSQMTTDLGCSEAEKTTGKSKLSTLYRSPAFAQLSINQSNNLEI